MDESRRKTVGGISTQEITSVTVRALDDSQARGGRISIQSRTIPEPDSKDKQSKDTNDNKKKTQEEGEQKKPSVWYEYGCV